MHDTKLTTDSAFSPNGLDGWNYDVVNNINPVTGISHSGVITTTDSDIRIAPAGITQVDTSITDPTFIFYPITNPRIRSVALIDNTIEVVLSSETNTIPSNRQVWKNIYGVVDGNIVLIDTKIGKIIPPATIEERIEF